MIPGEVLPAAGTITLNEGRPVLRLEVVNTGDRPVQVGSHFHLPQANAALSFDRAAAHGHRLDVPAGTSVTSSAFHFVECESNACRSTWLPSRNTSSPPTYAPAAIAP